MEVYLKKTVLALVLIAVAVSERLWWDLGPNVELITTTAVLACWLLGRRWAVAVALISLAISDLVIGNTLIMIFTWSAYALIAWGAEVIKARRGLKRAVLAGGYGLAASLFFYGYTNFGVWLIGGLYPPTLEGLLRSYVMGLPFLKLQAASNLLLVSGSVAVVEIVSQLYKLITLRVEPLADVTSAEKAVPHLRD